MDYAGKLSRRPQQSIAQLKRLVNLSMTATSFKERINNEARTVKTLFLHEEAQQAIQNFIKKSEK
jgi:enoyl-CoA hydratase/carnithine racemase